MKPSIKTIGLAVTSLMSVLAWGNQAPIPDLTKDTKSVDRKLTYNLGATGMPEFKGNVLAVDTAPFWDHDIAAADRAEASFACDSASLLSRIKPVAGQPLHFSIEGDSNYSFIPYWEVASKQTFTCFPIVTGKQSPQPVEKK